MWSLFSLMTNFAYLLRHPMYLHSVVKQALVLLLTVSLSQAIVRENEATLMAVCDNSTMHLTVSFNNSFEGTVYQYSGFYKPKCSYTVPFNMNVTEVNLSMPFGSCGIEIGKFENRTMASTEVVIQMHSLLDTAYDRIVNVSCEIADFHPVNDTEIEDPNSFQVQGLQNSFIEFKVGLVLFGEVGEPTESTLFMVVGVQDGGMNQDMVVQNCVAHTDKNVTDSTIIRQLSNFYGCPDSSAILPDFTVVRSGYDGANMYAYAPISNFSLIAPGGKVLVTCGITICESACPAHCNDTESPIRLQLSDYAVKDVVRRRDGAVMPDSLRQLNRNNDRSKRTLDRPKRSLRSFFSSIFRWESHTLTGSVSEGNVTNVTSSRKAEGMIVKHSLATKNVLVSSNVGSELASPNWEDDFHMDWETLRFILLMAVCLLISILACYCFADSKSRNRSVFDA